MLGLFMKKRLQKPNQTEFRVTRVIKKKGNKLYVKQKVYGNSFSSWLDKKASLYKMSYYLEPDCHSRSKTKVELDLSNYATKFEVKKAKGVDALNFLERLI